VAKKCSFPADFILCISLFVACVSEMKQEVCKWIYMALYLTLMALRHGSHSFTCKLHHACLYLVSVHQMAPSQTEVVDI